MLECNEHAPTFANEDFMGGGEAFRLLSAYAFFYCCDTQDPAKNPCENCLCNLYQRAVGNLHGQTDELVIGVFDAVETWFSANNWYPKDHLTIGMFAILYYRARLLHQRGDAVTASSAYRRLWGKSIIGDRLQVERYTARLAFHIASLTNYTFLGTFDNTLTDLQVIGYALAKLRSALEENEPDSVTLCKLGHTLCHFYVKYPSNVPAQEKLDILVEVLRQYSEKRVVWTAIQAELQDCLT